MSSGDESGKDPPPLTAAAAADVFQRLSERESLTLVGGQALSLLALQYFCPEIEQIGTFLSRDIDFQATKEEVRWVARKLSGEPHLPTGDHVGVSAGKVLFKDLDGYTRTIDILHNVHGLKPEEVRRKSWVAPLPEMATSVRTMHPVHCLISRTANVATLPGYQTPHALRQLRVSIVAVRGYIQDLVREDERAAFNCVREVFRLARGVEGRAVYRKFQIDVFEAVPTAGMPEKFIQGNYVQLSRKLDTQRTRYLASRSSHGPSQR